MLRSADSVYKYYHIRNEDTCVIHTTCISKVLRCNIAISFPVYSSPIPRLPPMIKFVLFSIQLVLVVGLNFDSCHVPTLFLSLHCGVEHTVQSSGGHTEGEGEILTFEDACSVCSTVKWGRAWCLFSHEWCQGRKDGRKGLIVRGHTRTVKVPGNLWCVRS